MERSGGWTAAPPWEKLGQMGSTWLSSDWKYLLSRQQRTVFLAACPSRVAAVLCQGNSCFHPPKCKITHSLHSPNSFSFLLLSVYKIQRLHTGLITSISFAEFTITFSLLTFLEKHTQYFVSETSRRDRSYQKDEDKCFLFTSLLFSSSPNSSLVWFSGRLSQLPWCLQLLLLCLLGEA